VVTRQECFDQAKINSTWAKESLQHAGDDKRWPHPSDRAAFVEAASRFSQAAAEWAKAGMAISLPHIPSRARLELK
jgi:hypothetical protein